MRGTDDADDAAGVTVTDPLVDAIHEGRLYETARSIAGDPGVDALGRGRAERAVAVCEQIGRVCEQWRLDLVETLRAGGCQVDAGEPIGPRQRHTIELARQHGNVLEIILKDTHTCQHHPERFDRWTQICRELINEFSA